MGLRRDLCRYEEDDLLRKVDLNVSSSFWIWQNAPHLVHQWAGGPTIMSHTAQTFLNKLPYIVNKTGIYGHFNFFPGTLCFSWCLFFLFPHARMATLLGHCIAKGPMQPRALVVDRRVCQRVLPQRLLNTESNTRMGPCAPITNFQVKHQHINNHNHGCFTQARFLC